MQMKPCNNYYMNPSVGSICSALVGTCPALMPPKPVAIVTSVNATFLDPTASARMGACLVRRGNKM